MNKSEIKETEETFEEKKSEIDMTAAGSEKSAVDENSASDNKPDIDNRSSAVSETDTDAGPVPGTEESITVQEADVPSDDTMAFRNWVLIGTGLALLTAGFIFLSFNYITLSPVLILLSYLVIGIGLLV